MSVESIPQNLRGLRACLLCSLVKTKDQFEYDGCDNCEEYLGLKHNTDMILDCTSNNFEGLIALCNPEDSWVAKWQNINRKTKGIYAISVSGRLPSGIIRELKSRGVHYRIRDRSVN